MPAWFNSLMNAWMWALIVCCVVVVLYFVVTACWPSTADRIGLMRPTREGMQTRTSAAEYEARIRPGTGNVLCFLADWCGHCKRAKPVLTELASDLGASTAHITPPIQFIFVDCSDEPESADMNEFMTKYDVDGFPSVRIQYNGQIYSMEADITRDSLLSFIDASLHTTYSEIASL